MRLLVSNQCLDGEIAVNFNRIKLDWNNPAKVDIYNDKRTYQNLTFAKVAGVQRMLSILGYDIDEIDGILEEKTTRALNEIGAANGVFGFNFKQLFPLLEQLIAIKHKLVN